MIKVLPSNQDMMKHLKHPTGVRFTSMNTPVEWPSDQFTMRRLLEGSIKEAESSPEEGKE
jgi:hypothetical protein